MSPAKKVQSGPRVPFAVPDIGDREISAVAEAMRSGWLTTGPNAAAFEQEFAETLGGDPIQAIAVNSATAGLHLALEALGVSSGDEVIVPTWTFTATAEVVEYLGARPVFVDVDPETYAIDFDSAQAAVSDRTKAIMPVHFAGRAIPWRRIRDFAQNNNLGVVEDAAHSYPSLSDGRLVGDSLSEAVVFSFYATKTMTTGEGGMVVTRDARLANRVRTMRLHGISRDVFDRYNSDKPNWYYEVVSAGYKYNMPDTAAAMGRVQLARAHEMRERRAAIAERYFAELGDIDALKLPTRGDDDDIHAWHLFVVELSREEMSRDSFVSALSARGVGTSVHFIPLHLQPFWKEKYSLESGWFPVATSLYERVVSLPIFSSMTDEQVSQVVSAVRSVLE